MILLMLDGNSA